MSIFINRDEHVFKNKNEHFILRIKTSKEQNEFFSL
jgi:hypothetical protein